MKPILKEPKNRKRLILALAGVVLLWLLLPMRESRLAVQVQEPERCDLEETIPVTGTIRPVMEVRITPEVSGEIVEIHVKEGDRVEAGDLILKIRQDLYLSQVDQAGASLGSLRAECARCRAEVSQARLNHERNQKLLELNAISTAEFQHTKTDLEIAKSRLKAAEFAIRSGEAQLKEARENLMKTTVYAPIGGIVSRMNVERGERVVGTSQMAGTELLRIADFSRMEVVVDVGENDIVHIHPNDSVRVEIDAYPRRRFRGFVTQIANSAKNMDDRFDQVTNFGVQIELLPDSVKFLPGMSAAADIVTQQKSDCLTVPAGSVFTRNREAFVWVVEGGKVASRKVSTGIQQHDLIEITDGLYEGERVVAGPPEAIEKQLTDGRRVMLTSRSGH